MFGSKRALIRLQIAAERRKKNRGSAAVKDQIVKKNKCGTTGMVEEHFLRHVQGSGWRGSHRRSPERLFRGPTETKKTPKNALAGLGRDKHKWRMARRRQERLEVEAHGRKVLRAPSRAGA